MRGARLRHSQPGKPVQRRARQVHLARITRAYREAAHAVGRIDRHARRISRNAEAGYLFAAAARSNRSAPRYRRADDAAAEPSRLFELRGLSRVRRARTVPKLRRDADLSSPGPAVALPLLQLHRARPLGLPEMPERAYLLSRYRLRKGRRRTAS